MVGLCIEKNLDHEVVYGRIVKDLEKVQTCGVQLLSNEIIKGVLLLIIGDNLGSHSLGGFTENFSTSKYFCRYCLIRRDQFEAKNGEFENYEERTIESYNNALEKIEQDCLEEYQGVKFNSVFNKLSNFHVCNPGLPPCWGHDGFEGVIAYDLQLYVNYFIKERWFSLDSLNDRILKFPYSIEDMRDKPCKIRRDAKKISGAACQVWQFLRLFPILILDKVKDFNDDVWYLVLLLTEITEIICAPEIHKTFLPYLQAIINEYLSLRKFVFPNIKLRPKHHYMHHYPDLIMKFGPPIKVWSLRFETKHTFFKRAIRALHNFTNITKSLSVKHELFQSYLRVGADLRFDVKMEKSGPFQIHIYCEEIKEALKEASLPSTIQECNSVFVKGTTFKKGNVMILSQSGYQFEIRMGRICLFLHDDDDNIYIVFEVLETTFHRVLRCYELGKMLKYECHAFNRCIKYEPLHVYTVGNFLCAKPKYGFVSKGL